MTLPVVGDWRSGALRLNKSPTVTDKEPMKKILWHSNAPFAPTGYGQQTALFAPMLAEHYDLTLSANYGLDGAPLMWGGNIPILPGLGQTHGNEAIPGHATKVFGTNWRDGLLVTLYDAQVFDPALFAKMNVACWAPVDHDPPPPRQIAFFRESGAIPIAMSRFGEEQLAEFDPLYVPHGIDTEVFKPYPREETREKLGFKDSFLVGMVAANKGRPSRKCFQQAFEAFRYFQRSHENAILYLHTTVEPEYAAGEDLLALLGSLEIPPAAVRLPHSYPMMFDPLEPRLMAQLYSAFDVLLNPSMGEGFGIPIVEAQACGTPAIVTDFSAMKETCGAGWKVGGRPFWTGQHSWMAIPDVGEIIGALEECYALTDGKRRALSTQARQHAAQYNAKTVFEDFMLPAFKEIEARIGDRKPVAVAA